MPEHGMTDQQIDRIKGVFYGQAIGDALGLGTEFMTKRRIAECYPNGLSQYAQIVQDEHRSRWRIGDWTDDTDQFLGICDSIIGTGRVDEKAFARELFKWFQDDPMGIGSTVLKVVTLPQFTEFPHQAAQLVWKASGRKGASNGAIMRTSILGTWAFWDLRAVADHTERIARVTHWDDRCVGSCVVVTSVIAHLLHEGGLMDAEALGRIADRYDQRIRPFLELAITGTIDRLELDEPATIGYTLKAMAAGLWACFHAEGFEDGLLRVIHQGGDADTNASVAGSLLGARFGYGAIPQRLVDGLLHKDVLEAKCRAYLGKLGEHWRTSTAHASA